jgi:hypothetical protein
MISKPVASPLADLGIARDHGRRHVSNDNPFSEAVQGAEVSAPSFPSGSAASRA